MLIGVLSDTHLVSPDTHLDYILEDLLGTVDMLLHAGDLVSHSVLSRLEQRGGLAVCGNMDDHEVAQVIPQKRIVVAGGKRIGLIHGWGSKQGLRARVLSLFESDKPDIIVYGHSHVPFWGEIDGVMMFNPGAATRNPYTGNGTVGRLEILEGSVEATFLRLDR
jgi:uncharacterized protein